MGTLLMLAGMGCLLYVVIFIQRKVQEVRTWPSVTGQVIEAGLSRSSSGGMETHNTTYGAKITYQYQVKNKVYRASTLKPGGQLELSTTSHAGKKLKRYGLNQEVTVFYNPQKPEEAYLEKEEEVSVLYGGIGIFLILVGWFL